MGIQLQVVHQPGVDNVLADHLSQNVRDHSEWSLDRQMVRHLFEMWGRPQIGLFVSANKTHLPLWCTWRLSLRHLVATMYRAISVCFLPVPAVTQDIGEDMGRQGGGS